MKFQQSRFQDYFSRCYQGSAYLVYLITITIILNSLFSTNIDLVLGMIISSIITLVNFIYIYIKFQSGSHSLEVTDSKIIFKDGKLVATIDNDDFQGYEVTRFLPHRVMIKNKVYGKIFFSYYAFSSTQRKSIFTLLDNHCKKNINKKL